MKYILGFALAGASAALALSLAPASFAKRAGIKVGDAAKYTWRSPLVNGMGMNSIEDLHGKPVLFDFWGIH